MRTLIAALLTLVICLASSLQATDWSAIVTQVEKSIVFIEVGNEGSCTGFVIDQAKHYVMTAQHCQPSESGVIWADRVPARVVSRDVQKDLLVIEAKDLDPARPALVLAPSNPAIGSEVMSAGFGMGLERPIYRQAHVSDDNTMIPEIGGPFISLDSAFVGGQSGGPVVNLSGEVVMIVQRASGTVGIGVGADIIRTRMGRFFSGHASPSKAGK
jgi:S1-C subfamily serine protease